jgi:hypothetical protein
MKSHWRKAYSLLPLSTQKKIFGSYFSKLHKEWGKDTSVLPPSHLSKQQHLKKWAKKNGLHILVETGTDLGEMVFAMQDDFNTIISIELAEVFYKKAKRRFNQKHIQLLHGDSGKLLKDVMQQLEEPALIWLDGHYSGGATAKGEKECPVYEELQNIFSSKFDHTILVDDARLFIGINDYPTINELKAFVITNKPSYQFLLDNDAIIITPNA